ncbi:hypothetical protein L1N85_08970 [Paenibacillus alkaliterrae]|uniref:hypothetical protein n=1 Tax=Paenibacillus alkaliterrae TaxID=320909 RepID=UPI001F4088FB|nr:hypothetical protein [Paenibacillus alkaliterrae]MCF2938566.1 hypothetical protein [Paenibacillus alkaliterrae]
MLFGDDAGAFLVEASEDGHGDILSIYSNTDGSQGLCLQRDRSVAGAKQADGIRCRLVHTA